LAITSLAQTPIISVLALGFSTGEIHLHNIRTDRPMFTLNGSDSGIIAATARGRKRVTSLSFCTDPVVGAGKSKGEGGKVLAVGDDDGDVTLWNLKKRKVSAIMRGVHEGPSGGGVVVEWLAGQNVLVTSGGDNSVKVSVTPLPNLRFTLTYGP
jgi:U3 small nucleolar RNA-associated protein 21